MFTRGQRTFIVGVAIGAAYYVGKWVAYREVVTAEVERFLAGVNPWTW